MSAPPTPSAAPDALPSAEALERAYIAEELARMASLEAQAYDIAQTIWRRATGVPAEAAPAETAPSDPETPVVDIALFGADLSLAHHRAARTVRLTSAVRGRLIADLKALEAGVAGAASKREPVDPLKSRRETIVDAIQTLAEAQLGDDDDDGQAIDHIVHEARERLIENDGFGDLLSRPISEAISLLCEERGLIPDWPRLAERAWAGKAQVEAAFTDAGGRLTRVEVQLVRPPPLSYAPTRAPGAPPPPTAAPAAIPQPPPPDEPEIYGLPGEYPPPRRRRY